MDPQYVKVLRDAKSLLDDGIFSEKEFEDQKEILKQRFHVSQPGVSPAVPVAAPFHVSPQVLSMPAGYMLFAHFPILSSTGKIKSIDQALSAT
jgi:hypothetical protein